MCRGVQTGIKMYIISWIVTYVVIALGVFFFITPWYHLIAFLWLPFALQSILVVKKDFRNLQQLPSGNLAMI
jgi:1,4-dihydroxy-2-naphthoate octaprenyltransferase